MTSPMSQPPDAAANSSGANILVAVANQKSPSAMVPTDDLATSVNPAAARRAAGQVRDEASGDHEAEAIPVDPVGSKHRTSPPARRKEMVWSTRSVLTLAATAGPDHSSRA